MHKLSLPVAISGETGLVLDERAIGPQAPVRSALSLFEFAWLPFISHQMRHHDDKVTPPVFGSGGVTEDSMLGCGSSQCAHVEQLFCCSAILLLRCSKSIQKFSIQPPKPAIKPKPVGRLKEMPCGSNVRLGPEADMTASFKCP